MTHAVITTSHRDVWYGEVIDRGDNHVTLTNARHCYYWDTDEGLGQLATDGPGTSAKIGPAIDAECEIRDVVTILECSDDAVARFTDQGWGGPSE